MAYEILRLFTVPLRLPKMHVQAKRCDLWSVFVWIPGTKPQIRSHHGTGTQFSVGCVCCYIFIFAGSTHYVSILLVLKSQKVGSINPSCCWWNPHVCWLKPYYVIYVCVFVCGICWFRRPWGPCKILHGILESELTIRKASQQHWSISRQRPCGPWAGQMAMVASNRRLACPKRDS